jgi:hypothetical protein
MLLRSTTFDNISDGGGYWLGIMERACLRNFRLKTPYLVRKMVRPVGAKVLVQEPIQRTEVEELNHRVFTSFPASWRSETACRYKHPLFACLRTTTPMSSLTAGTRTMSRYLLHWMSTSARPPGSLSLLPHQRLHRERPW